MTFQNFSIRALVAIFLLTMLITNTPTANAAKKSKGKKNAIAQTKTEAWPKTIEKVEFKKWTAPRFKPDKKYKGYSFLNFDQIAKLEFSKRVQYIALMRKTAVEIEKFQFMFRNSTIYDASHDALKKDKSLYAILFGSEPAVAQGAPKNCIYGGDVSSYDSDDKDVYVPFTCKVSTPCGNGGQRCSYGTLGIPSTDKRSCIPRKDRHNSTLKCDDLRHVLTKENEANIVDALQNSHNQFNTNLARGKHIRSEDLTGKNAELALQMLAENIYDDRVMAELIRVLNLYKSTNMSDALEKILAKLLTDNKNNEDLQKMFKAVLSTNSLENGIHNFQKSVTAIFKDYVDHCNEETPPAVIDQIKGEEINPRLMKQAGSRVRDEMARRVIALKVWKEQIDAGKLSKDNTRPKNKEVLEYHECLRVETRIKLINDELERLGSTLPNFADEKTEVPKPEPLKEKPPLPVKNPKVESIGCEDTYTDEKHHLSQPAARCLACVAEKDKLKSQNPDYTSGGFKNPYNISTKWLSLLSTMAVACPDAVNNGTSVRFDTMLHYIQTFGHCGADTYSWPEGENMPAEDRKLIELWANQNMFSNDEPESEEMKTHRKKVDEEFQRVYGLSYNKAALIFCDNETGNEQFEKEWYDKSRIKKRNVNYKTPQGADVLTSFAGRRKTFASYLENPTSSNFFVKDDPGYQVTDNASSAKLPAWFNGGYEKGDYPKAGKDPKVAPGLWKCMNESLANAEKLYSGNENTCSEFVPMASFKPNQETFLKMARGIVGAPGRATTVMAQHNGTNCKGAHGVETLTEGDKVKIGIQMVDNTKWNDPNRKSGVTMQFWSSIPAIPGEKLNEPDVQVNATGDSNDVSDLTFKVPIDLQNYSMIVPSGRQCAILAGSSASGTNQQRGQTK